MWLRNNEKVFVTKNTRNLSNPAQTNTDNHMPQNDQVTRRATESRIALGASRQMLLPEAIETIKKGLAQYQNENVSSITQTPTQHALRQARSQLDLALKAWVISHPPEEQQDPHVEGTLLEGLQQRIAVEKALKSVLPWNQGTTQDTEITRAAFHRWHQKVAAAFEEVASAQDPDCARVATLYNLRLLLLDVAKPKSHWKQLQWSIRVG
jgi:hypothetical protein